MPFISFASHRRHTDIHTYLSIALGVRGYFCGRFQHFSLGRHALRQQVEHGPQALFHKEVLGESRQVEKDVGEDGEHQQGHSRGA